MVWASLFLLLFQAASGEVVSPPPSDVLPFWKSKEKLYRRISEERAIIVSVRTEKLKDGGETLIFGGGGHISTPQEFAFDEAMKIENLKEVSDYVKEARLENGQIFLRAKAFGYEASMWIKRTPMPKSGIHFEIEQGTLKGLKGDLHFEKIGLTKTEIGISGHYDYVHFPIARIFAEFGMEVILQRMAIRLRGLIEEHYKAMREKS